MSSALAAPFSSTINCRVSHRHVNRGALLPFSASSLLLPTSRRSNLRTHRFSLQSQHKVQAEDELDEEACELVNGLELTLGDGIRAHLFQAVKNNNGTPILLLSDIFGFQDSSTRDFAYRTACNGYNVLVPDLFRGNPWRHDQPRSMFEQWLATQDAERAAKDIETSANWMVEEFVEAGISKRLGIVGFCYGGGRVIDVLARDRGSQFGTGVSFYGTRMDKSVAVDVKVPVLFIAGDKDPLCPVDNLSELARIVGNDSRVAVFEGRGHGFAHRPQSNEEDIDAEEAFLIMRNWLHDPLLSCKNL